MVRQSPLIQRLIGNTPPTTASSKSAAGKSRTAITNATRRRRAHEDSTKNSKHNIKEAKRRSLATRPSSNNTIILKLKARDVEMSEEGSSVRIITLKIARELIRPEPREVRPEALAAVDENLSRTPPQFVRDALKELGPTLLQALSSSKLSAPLSNALPTEVLLKVQDLSVAPTHMMAVHNGRRSTEQEGKSKITLFAGHNIVLAAHCTKLSPFAPSPVASLSEEQSSPGPIEVNLPVRSLCLPCPEMFPSLLNFLYTNQTTQLLETLVPGSIPADFEVDQVNQLRPFAKKLGETYSIQHLLARMQHVLGLWQNVCSLGVCDDDLWDTMDLAWDIYLHALAVATNQPNLLDSY